MRRFRGRLHLCHDEEKTLTRLVDDWERHAHAEPDTSTVVLSRTRAEARALSWLMRERVLAGHTDIKRAVIEVSRDLDGRVTEPLEIAVGDRIRIGATQWEKQLFNGTVVTVENLEVQRGEGKAAARTTGTGREDEATTREPEKPGDESPVQITARTDDGRRVTFRHDEIRDWHDNIRLDYGYAMTIASAQGLTVDRAFLLVDDRPARETIYPAATRHREGIDIYVNRSPLAFDIADRRSEDQTDMPVTDSDVRAYLAERWSRSQPKEAALDYTTDGAWRDPRDEPPRHGRPVAEARDQAVEARAAVNDNALVRIAGEIRHAVNGWRHGAAVDAFAAERRDVMAAWGELRARARDEGEAVALSPTFRETLERHGRLMKQAVSFAARPSTFERLLAERADIGEFELAELGEVHARAGKYLRSVKARTSHTARHDAERTETGIFEAIAAGTTASATELPIEEHTQAQPIEPVAHEPLQDAEPEWETVYDRLERDWTDLVAVANQAGLPLPLVRGYDELIGRVRELAHHSELPLAERDELTQLLDYHRRETAVRSSVHDYLAAAERHVTACESLQREAERLDTPIADVDGWLEWRQDARQLVKAGRTILADEDTYGAYLDAVAAGKPRTRLVVDQLRDRIEDDRVEAMRAEKPETRREPVPKQEKGIAYILEDAEKLKELRKRAQNQDRKLGRHRRRRLGLSM